MLNTRIRVAVLAFMGTLLAVGQIAPTAAEAATINDLKVDFTTQTGTVASGFKADFGQAFDASRGYGWTDTSGAALSLVGNGRERNAIADKRLDTLLQMQMQTTPYAAGVHTEGKWKAAVANGTYAVTVALGDPSYFDSANVINVEGVRALGFTPTASASSKSVTVNVNVTDGFINVDATGGTNTKIQSIEIAQTGAAVTTTTQAPTTTTAAPVNSSATKFDFTTQNGALKAGSNRDYGQAYDSNRKFGWTDNSGAPLSIVGNGRERSVNVNNSTVFDSTVVQMQMDVTPQSAGVHTEGRWKAAVANGTYAVQVLAGDPSYYDSKNVINVEGVKVIDFTPTSAAPQKLVAVQAVVTDGFLNIDASGGVNSKLAYVDYALKSAGSTPTTAPAPTTTTTKAPTSTTTAPTSTTAVNASGSIALSAADDYAGNGTRLVFSTSKWADRDPKNVTIKNTGSTALKINSLVFSGPQGAAFQLASGQASSFSVAPGATEIVKVVFKPIQLDNQFGTLTVNSSDPKTPALTVALGGVNKINYEDIYEATLQEISNGFGYTTNIGMTYELGPTSVGNGDSLHGDEVRANYFARLDSSKAVNLYPMAQYGGRGTYSSTMIQWFNKGESNSRKNLYNFPGGSDESGGENQRLTPKINSGGTTTFNPAGSFGIFDGDSFLADSLNGNSTHNYRVYPAKDASGKTISGTYIIGVDWGFGGQYKNWDCQDYAFLITNVKIAS